MKPAEAFLEPDEAFLQAFPARMPTAVRRFARERALAKEAKDANDKEAMVKARQRSRNEFFFDASAVFTRFCSAADCGHCLSAKCLSAKEATAPCWFRKPQVTAYLVVKVNRDHMNLNRLAHNTNVIFAQGVFAESSPRVQTFCSNLLAYFAGSLGLTRDPLPEEAKQVEEFVSTKLGSRKEGRDLDRTYLPCLELAQLLLLASWKLADHPAAKKMYDNYYSFLGPSEGLKEAASVPLKAVFEDRLREQRRALHEAAADFAVMLYNVAASPLDRACAFNVFLAVHGTKMAHVFQIGSGAFPFVEAFFENLETAERALWSIRHAWGRARAPGDFDLLPLKKDPETGALKTTGGGLDPLPSGAECSVCDEPISTARGKSSSIFPLAYTFSRNAYCFPRVISRMGVKSEIFGRNHDREPTRQEQNRGLLACSPTCMLRHAFDVVFALDRPVFPIEFAGQSELQPFASLDRDQWKVRFRQKSWRLSLADTMSSWPLDDIGLFARWAFAVADSGGAAEAAWPFVPVEHDTYMGVPCPDYLDFTYRDNSKVRCSSTQIAVLGFIVTSPGIFEEGMMVHGAWEKMGRMKTNKSTWASIPAQYRQRITSLVNARHTNTSETSHALNFSWHPRWGMLNDFCLGLAMSEPLTLRFRLADELESLQPKADTCKAATAMLAAVSKNRTSFLLFPARHGFFNLREYMTAVKYAVTAVDVSHYLWRDLGDAADCYVFACGFDCGRRQCCGGVLFREAGKTVALVMPRLFTYLSGIVPFPLFSEIAFAMSLSNWSLNACLRSVLTVMSSKEINFRSEQEHLRFVVALYLQLVLTYRRQDRKDKDFAHPDILCAWREKLRVLRVTFELRSRNEVELKAKARLKSVVALPDNLVSTAAAEQARKYGLNAKYFKVIVHSVNW